MNELENLNIFSKSANRIVSSDDIVYASNEEEFFYEDTGEPVPLGEAVGIEVHVPEFRYLNKEQENLKELEENPDHSSALKFRTLCSEEREDYFKGFFDTKEIKLVLFKNIYHQLNYEES